MINSDDLVLQAKQLLPLTALMAQLGLGDRAKKTACCLFHDDSSASFSLYLGHDGQERWKCFAGCGQGDAIDFLARYRGLSNTDACREYIRLAGLSLPGTKPLAARNQPAFDWSACAAALTTEHRRKLADWRGYALNFVDWLHVQSFIGLFDGERIALAVHDKRGSVVGCHYRRNEDRSWRYHPTGTRTAPLIVGELATAKRILVFESQWDLFAVLDRLKHHIEPSPDTAAIATRGASNGRLLAGLIPEHAVIYAFGQNDEAGSNWSAAVAAIFGPKTFQAITPLPHKDPNDWTRAGATADEIRRAIAEAQPMTATTRAELESEPPQTGSQSLIALLDETDEPEAEPFPLDALPPTMATIIAAVSSCERVPVPLPAVCALGVASAAIGAGLEVASGPNRVTRGNLYLLASAESGSGKSETFRLIAAPLVDHQNRKLVVWRQKTLVAVESEMGVLKREIATLERKAAKSIDSMERDRWLSEVEFKRAREGELTRQSAMPCIIAQDVTTERLAVLLRDNREVVFSASADARKLVDNLLGRYNPGKTTDESLYLSAYSGDFVRVDRQGRETVVLNKPCLALCWFIQPDLLTTMLDEQSLSSSGFLPRLLVCDTRATPRRIEGEPQPIPVPVQIRWTQLIESLLAAFHATDKPHLITPTPEAAAILNDFHNRIVDRRAADLADVGAFAARYAENAWRLAVVFHAVQWGADSGKEPLIAEIAASAVRVIEWFAMSGLDILAKGRHAAATKREDEVLELIETNRERKAQDFTTARDVHRARITATADAARALLTRLEDEGLLVGEDVRPEHGGKTTRIFRRVRNPASG